MTVKLRNNVVSSLRTELLSSSTTVILPVGHGVRFPSLGAGEYFYATIEDAAGNSEIVQATARATDTLTVVRGAEGTTPRTFAAGSTVEMRVTAASVLDAASDAADAVDLTTFGVTASAAELNILDGVTASTAEINVLDGITATTAELNILDGVTASAAELNILDGMTASTAELNYVDGVTSAIQTQLDAKQPLSSDLTAIAGLVSAAGKLPYATGAGTWAMTDISSFARAFLNDNNAAVARTTLEIATLDTPDWQAGTSTTEARVSPAKVKQAIDALGARLVLGTAVASTSGTSIDFTGIPSWAKRVTVMFNGVSLSSTASLLLVRLGTSGGLQTSGYVSNSGLSTATNGLCIQTGAAAANTLYGHLLLTRISGNTWVSSHTANGGNSGSGGVTLSDTLDRLSILNNASNNFDAGSINIMWE